MKNQSFLRRFGFALAGLGSALRSEASIKLEVLAAILVFVVLVWLRPAPVWWAIAALAVGLVLMAELVNTAIEHLADYVQPQWHAQIKIVKDCAAGAVLIACLAAIGVALALLCEVIHPL